MTKDNNKLEKDPLEEIIELTERGRALTDEEKDRLLQDDEAMRAYKDFVNSRSALLLRYDPLPTNVNDEWNRFQHRTQKKSVSRTLWISISGVAAAALLFLGYLWWAGNLRRNEEVVAFQAIDAVQQVVLQTTTGEALVLAHDTKDDALASFGTLLDRRDTLSLTYTAPQKVEMHTLTTPRGQDFKVVLSDGTTVWMNAESRLEYPSRFDGAVRSVALQGEAYFQVAKDSAHPFVIRTEQMQVRVLGTELNVRNYAAHDSHVTLINGSIEVGDPHRKEVFTTLIPGQDAQWQAEGSFLVKSVDVDAYIYWKQGYFYFDDVPLIDIMQCLGRWYNINVIFNNSNVMKYRMRYFCDRHDTLEQALILLNRMKIINVRSVGDTVYID